MLLQELRSKNAIVAERKIVRDWFQFWLEHGRGLDLLKSLEALLLEDSISSSVAEILDLAFETSIQLEGKGRAYHWLVSAQIHQHGWDEYYGKEDALRRFSTFARYYKSKWKQFLLETTRSLHHERKGSLTIPHHRLVHFLLAVEETATAKAVVEAMVDTTCDDFSEQPLEDPPWLGTPAG